jgi:bifunctional aspartokinase / homoserine dehydrogenase 1
MAGIPGIAAKVFDALGNAAVNVRAIAQGASERNISVVVPGRHATRALRAVHSSFYLSPHTLSIGIIGPGTVGRVLLEQLASQSERLRREFKLDLRVRGIMASKKMLLSDKGVTLSNWAGEFAQAAAAPISLRFVEHVQVDYLPHTVMIDCTASGEVAKHYAKWLAAGIHIVTPNKKANSAPLADYRALHEARRAGGSHYLYEATVGAGLPVIQTLRDLRETGDDITSIEGIFSGTLAYLFNVYDGSVPFSDIVKDAKQRGYTEPDPRDDLSGTDVARKLIILAREMGLTLELGDVRIESLVPAGLESGGIEEFLGKLPVHDAAMRSRYEAAAQRGKVLRYVGRITAEGAATVGVVELDRKHAFANIALTDNVVRFATSRYCNNPLIVQGPGAGPEVTAGGIFADLLRLSAYLGSAPVSGRDSATAFAPASVANVATGFDILGFAVDALGDTITVRRSAQPGVRITGLPVWSPTCRVSRRSNTAGRALLALNVAVKPSFGFDMHIEKGIPLGSGLGGSAASAVGAVVAANALLDAPLPKIELLKFAMQGEAVASGSIHADNISPSCSAASC